MDLSLLKELWLWFNQDLIGNEIVAVIVFLTILFVAFDSLNVPKHFTLALMIPAIFAFTMMGFLSWFGWIIIGICGLIFGMYVLRFYGGI